MNRPKAARLRRNMASDRLRTPSPANAQHGTRRGAKTRSERFEGEPEAEPAGAHVLLAEDDDEMRHILRESLVEAGYRVTDVANGSDLRRHLIRPSGPRSASTPDVVVSDIRLPGFTGIEVLEELRRSDWSLPVILITAFGDEAIHQEAKRLGAALVLDKPFDVEDLIEAVLALAPP